MEAIGAVYPHSQAQRRIVHQIRSSTRFVSYKDIKPLMADLKKAYTAVTGDEALDNLMAFKEKWGKRYPSCVKSPIDALTPAIVNEFIKRIDVHAPEMKVA